MVCVCVFMCVCRCVCLARWTGIVQYENVLLKDGSLSPFLLHTPWHQHYLKVLITSARALSVSLLLL